ncbi:MAG: hypothetical protein IT430_04940 [Phycisphaerales bacterium]|nr:hypothetical protein [Phycisphaerales bacterium]
MLCRITLVMTCGLLFAAPGFARDSATPPSADPAAARELQPPPLAGPRVHLSDAPGAAMSFGADRPVERAFKANLRQYISILKDMDLSDEQRRQAEAIAAQYQQDTQQYLEEHAAEFRRLRSIIAQENRSAGPLASAAPGRAGDAVTDRVTDRRPAQVTDRPTDRPAAPGEAPRSDAPQRPATDAARGDRAGWPVPTAKAREAMEQMAALRQGAPPQEPYMKRLYDLLTAQQQVEFDRRLEETRAAQQEQQLRRRLAAAGIAPEAMDRMMDGMQLDDAGRPMLDESQLTPQMRERLRRARAERQRLFQSRQRANPAPPSPDEIEFEQPQR